MSAHNIAVGDVVRLKEKRSSFDMVVPAGVLGVVRSIVPAGWVVDIAGMSSDPLFDGSSRVKSIFPNADECEVVWTER